MDREGVVDGSSNLPAELLGPTPRDVRLSRTGWVNLLAAALFFTVGVAGVTALVKQALHEAAIQDTLRRDGSEVLATITETWHIRAGLRIRYSFSVGGTKFTGTSVVPVARSKSLRQGDSLPIRYIPANPDMNHPAVWEDSPYSTLWLIYFPATFAFIGLMFIRRFPMQRQLAIHGIAVRGSIAKTEWNGPSKGQRYANYTFRNAENDEVEIGRCPNDYIYKADSACWVLYLPNNPRRNEVYPFPIDFFRINQ